MLSSPATSYAGRRGSCDIPRSGKPSGFIVPAPGTSCMGRRGSCDAPRSGQPRGFLNLRMVRFPLFSSDVSFDIALLLCLIERNDDNFISSYDTIITNKGEIVKQKVLPAMRFHRPLYRNTQSRRLDMRRSDTVGTAGKHLCKSYSGQRSEEYRLRKGEGFTGLAGGEGETGAGGR